MLTRTDVKICQMEHEYSLLFNVTTALLIARNNKYIHILILINNIAFLIACYNQHVYGILYKSNQILTMYTCV